MKGSEIELKVREFVTLRKLISSLEINLGYDSDSLIAIGKLNKMKQDVLASINQIKSETGISEYEITVLVEEISKEIKF